MEQSSRSYAIASFENRLIAATKAVKDSHLKGALVIHHDEADGLCSGALTKLALDKLGLETHPICLDKLYRK
jgi:single-stranded DNA-specific DHH superfamily exonuclease